MAKNKTSRRNRGRTGPTGKKEEPARRKLTYTDSAEKKEKRYDRALYGRNATKKKK